MTEVMKSFGIEWKLLLWQAVNFGLLFLILSKFFYKPARKVMKEREDKVRESLERADALEKKSEELEGKFRRRMAEERKEIEDIHKRALEGQEKLRKELLVKTEEEAQRIFKEAEQLAAEEKAQVLKSLEDEIKKTAVLLASKILEKEINEKTEKKFLEQALGELKRTAG